MVAYLVGQKAGYWVVLLKMTRGEHLAEWLESWKVDMRAERKADLKVARLVVLWVRRMAGWKVALWVVKKVEYWVAMTAGWLVVHSALWLVVLTVELLARHLAALKAAWTAVNLVACLGYHLVVWRVLK